MPARGQWRRYSEARQPFSPPTAPHKVGPISEQSSWLGALGQHHVSTEPKGQPSSYPREAGRICRPACDPGVPYHRGRGAPPAVLTVGGGGLSHSRWQHDTA